jgi:glucose-1-phosphate thymidylyltransferase
VVLSSRQEVEMIQVKQQNAATNWIWGAIKMSTAIYRDLYRLWIEREREDKFIGTLINAWIARGGRGYGIPEGSDYLDVGTID